VNLFLGILLFSFATSFSLVVPTINLLYRWKFTKKKESKEIRLNTTSELEAIRAKHDQKSGTPTGLGILLVVLITLLFLVTLPILTLNKPMAALFSGYSIGWEVGVLLLCFVGFGLLGLYDDLLKIFGFAKTGFFGLRRFHKFAIQWLLAFLVSSFLYWGLKIDFINIPILGIWHLGVWYLLLASFLIVTFANAFDITSGLDGLGEGLLLISLIAFWGIAATNLDQVLSLFIAIWIGALIAGIYFTINPARAFLGNASGMAFGATLAVVGLLSGKVIALIVIGGMFLIDAGSSLLQIVSKGILKRRIFPIAPIHHWLELIGWEEAKIVSRAWILGIMLAVFGVWLTYI